MEEQAGLSDYIEHTAAMHENSKELTDFIAANAIVAAPKACRMHELGCGSGRNLRYLKESFPYMQVSGNDLDRQACDASMEDSFKQLLTFYEQDTHEFLRSEMEKGNTVDLLMTSDHLMHLSRRIIRGVYALMARYATQSIVLREPVGNRVTLVKDGGGRYEYLWAADRFENRFPGFTMTSSQRCRNAAPGRDYTLNVFQEDLARR